jgi:succinyl-CoA synthetase beta subunit
MLSQKTGVDTSSVQANFRSEQSIEDFFDLYDLDVKTVAQELGLPTKRTDFFREIMRVYKANK